MLSQRRIISACIAGAAAVVVMLAILVTRNAWITDRSVRNSPAVGWEEINATEWEFSAQMPAPIERTKTIVPTPYGDAPLETYAGSMGPVAFTIAVAQYDPRVAKEFTEQERYQSSARETPKLLGGVLVRNLPVQQGQVAGREHVIEVADKSTIHSRSFLIGDRSYQIQVVYPSRSSLDPEIEEFFLDSLTIKPRDADK